MIQTIKLLLLLIRHPLKTLGCFLRIKATEYYDSAIYKLQFPRGTLHHSMGELHRAIGDLLIAISEAVGGGHAK